MSESSKAMHLPTPWHVGEMSPRIIYAKDGSFVLDAGDANTARHIVACVNACEGLSDQELFDVKTRLAKVCLYRDAKVRAEKQRDELLEVCELMAFAKDAWSKVVHYMNERGDAAPSSIGLAMERAVAASAKVR